MSYYTTLIINFISTTTIVTIEMNHIKIITIILCEGEEMIYLDNIHHVANGKIHVHSIQTEM